MSEAVQAVAAQSRPGSLEARTIYGCTCRPAPVQADRSRRWDPELAIDWVDVLTFDCPAHGELMVRAEKVAQDLAVDRLRRHVLSGEGVEARSERMALPEWARAEADNDNTQRISMAERLEAQRQEFLRNRSFRERVRDALVGALNGWRGFV